MCIQGVCVCMLHVQKYVALFFDSLPHSLERSVTEWKPAVLVRLAGQGQGAPRLCLSLVPNATRGHTPPPFCMGSGIQTQAQILV